ncbi:MAG: Crp/Fnr family transcriptional regulator [Desulfovibrio sp.]|nr:Crp/Fnr family transcriptional regulator [Desulfovibrio sp.]
MSDQAQAGLLKASALAQRKAEYEAILRSIGTEHVLQKGELLRTDHICYLLKGLCILSFYGPCGDETSLLFFEPGRLFNFMPKLSRLYPLQPKTLRRKLPRDAFAVRAKEESILLFIDHNVFERELAGSLPLHSLLVQSLTENCENLISHAGNSPLLPAPQRICRLLAEMMEEAPPHAVPPFLSYNEISLHLGIHPITVAKIFKALKEEGITARQGRMLTVADPERLRAIARGLEEFEYKRS